MISVIIPTYNSEKYIDKCLKSIFKQTYKNLEVIVVNDGSTDSTAKICSKYLKNKNFKLINKENEGPGIARKFGLDNATGEYISFIDSDDYIEKDFYKILINRMQETKLDIIECGYTLVDENGTILRSSKMYDEFILDNCVEHYILQKNTTNYLCNKIYKKKLFDKVVFPGYFAGEDACVLLQVFSNAEKTAVIKDNLYNYVQTQSSLCRKPYNLKKNDSVQAGIFMYNFCLKKHKNLADYYASYICSCAALCYANLKYSKIENKEIHMKRMKLDFDKYLIKDEFKKLKISNSRKLLIKLFNISPLITSFIYKRWLRK